MSLPVLRRNLLFEFPIDNEINFEQDLENLIVKASKVLTNIQKGNANPIEIGEVFHSLKSVVDKTTDETKKEEIEKYISIFQKTIF